jgi:hypothetical protein
MFWQLPHSGICGATSAISADPNPDEVSSSVVRSDFLQNWLPIAIERDRSVVDIKPRWGFAEHDLVVLEFMLGQPVNRETPVIEVSSGVQDDDPTRFP